MHLLAPSPLIAHNGGPRRPLSPPLTRLQLLRLHVRLLHRKLRLPAEALAVAALVLAGLLQRVGLIGRGYGRVQIEHLQWEQSESFTRLAPKTCSIIKFSQWIEGWQLKKGSHTS